MAEELGKQIGLVTHYFDKIGVAIIELSDSLNAGDEIRIVGSQMDFTQNVESMEVEKQKVESAKKGEVVGLKVSQKAKEGCKVYKA